MQLAFTTLEVAGFLLPAFAPQLHQRLAILGIYCVAHLMGATRPYAAFKRRHHGH